MSDNVVYTNQMSLFTLNGLIAVQFMDGEITEGEFAAQDAYNIFLTVNGSPVMIPRLQIRTIKGLQGQQIEKDTTQEVETKEELLPPALQEAKILEPPLDDSPVDTIEEAPSPEISTQPMPSETDFSPLGTLYQSAPAPLPEAPAFIEDKETEDEIIETVSEFLQVEDEDDDLLILVPDITEPLETEDDGDDDEGTLILAADTARSEEEDDDDDDEGTMILNTSDDILSAAMPSLEDDEELDMTVVLGGPGMPDEDELTVALEFEEEQEAAATLTCTSGPHNGEVFHLTGGIVTVGRSGDNVITLSGDKEISRHHAIILQESGSFVIQDQNSLNSTFVNDKQVTGPTYLNSGDVILVGISTLQYKQA